MSHYSFTYGNPKQTTEAGRSGWLVQFRINGASRKARGTTKRECEANRDRMIEEARNASTADSSLHLSGLVEAFVSRRGVRAEGTLRQYRTAVQRLIDAVGDKPVADLTRDDIELVMSRMAAAPGASGPMKASTIGAWRKALNPVLAWAVDHGKAASNPLAGVKVATFNAAASEAPRFLDLTDTVLLTKYLRAELTDPHVACLLMLHAGLRISEALGLAWADVDIEGRTITVRRQADGRGGFAPKLKTASSGRTLTNLPRMLMNALAEHRAAHPDAVLVCTSSATKRRAITATRGPRGVQYALAMACERAGVAEVNPHGLRHTAGSMVYEATGNLTKVARFLGHVDLVLVTRLYVHDVSEVDTGSLVDALMGDLS